MSHKYAASRGCRGIENFLRLEAASFRTPPGPVQPIWVRQRRPGELTRAQMTLRSSEVTTYILKTGPGTPDLRPQVAERGPTVSEGSSAPVQATLPSTGEWFDNLTVRSPDLQGPAMQRRGLPSGGPESRLTPSRTGPGTPAGPFCKV